MRRDAECAGTTQGGAEKTEENLLVFITDKEDGDILLSVVISKYRRDNGQKLKYTKFHLSIRKKHFVSEGAQQVVRKVFSVCLWRHSRR